MLNDPVVRQIVFVGEFEQFHDLDAAQTRARVLAEQGLKVTVMNVHESPYGTIVSLTYEAVINVTAGVPGRITANSDDEDW